MVSIIQSLLLLAVAATAVEAQAVECATQCTSGCVTVDVPANTGVTVTAECPSGEFPYIDSIKVDSAAYDVFSVTTYTNELRVETFEACSLTSSDGCEVSTTVSCGLGLGEQTVVLLSCLNPTDACRLRHDIDFICAEVVTATPTTSSPSSTGSSTSESTTSPVSSSSTPTTTSASTGSSTTGSTTSSTASSTTAPTTSTPAASTSSRPATWSTSSPAAASSSSSASNSTDASGAMSRLSWKTIALSCGAVLGLNAMFV